MLKVPPARIGQEDVMDVQKLLDVQELVKKWKGKFCRLKGTPNGMTEHTNSRHYPKMIHLEPAKSENAGLMTVLGGKNSILLTFQVYQ